jgi:hypothetical protein
MHSRITEVAGGPGDGGSSFVQEKVLPGFESAHGFEGLVLLVAEGGRGISVALFRDQDAVEATDEQAAGFRSEASCSPPRWCRPSWGADRWPRRRVSV